MATPGSTPAENLPSTPRAEYVAALPDVTLIRHLMAGTRVMQEVASTEGYLPQYPAEEPANYRIRIKAAKVYGGLSRTLSAAIGMLFAKPPALDDRFEADGSLAAIYDNIDLMSTAGSVFAKRFAEDCTADGFGGILVDFPPVPAGVTVTSDLKAQGNFRPYFRRYQRSSILSWRIGLVNNKVVPTQIVLAEPVTSDVGQFGSVTTLQYRVLRVVVVTDADSGRRYPVASWETLIESTDGTTKTVKRTGGGFFVDAEGKPFPEIPFAVGYAGRTDAPFTAKPPLLDVAFANLYYWRKETSYNDHNDLCAFPMLHIEGRVVDDKGVKVPLKLGPRSLIETANEGTVAWVERQGGAAEILVTAMDREKRDMAELGMNFLAGDTRAAETAKAKQLDATAENATISTAATGIEDGLNQAFVYLGWYVGIPTAEAPTITMNRDFENVVMDAQTMVAYVTAVEKAGLPAEELLRAWQRGGRLPLDADLTKIANQMRAEMQARADMEAAEAEARLDAAKNRSAA